MKTLLDDFLNNPYHLQTYEFDSDGYHYTIQYNARENTYGYGRTKNGEFEMGNISKGQIIKLLGVDLED